MKLIRDIGAFDTMAISGFRILHETPHPHFGVASFLVFDCATDVVGKLAVTS